LEGQSRRPNFKNITDNSFDRSTFSFECRQKAVNAVQWVINRLFVWKQSNCNSGRTVALGFYR